MARTIGHERDQQRPGVVVPRGAGSWTRHDERIVWSSDWLDLAVADVSTPSGQRFTYDVVRARWDHAACLVVNDANQIMLTWRHRFVTDQWGWELPSGAVPRGEDLGTALADRIATDCGWSIHDQRLVWSLPQCPESTDRTGHLLWARAGECLGPPDPEAVAQVGWFDLREARSALDDSIHDLSTAAALLWLLAR